jgi:hypothetical protein
VPSALFTGIMRAESDAAEVNFTLAQESLLEKTISKVQPKWHNCAAALPLKIAAGKKTDGRYLI